MAEYNARTGRTSSQVSQQVPAPSSEVRPRSGGLDGPSQRGPPGSPTKSQASRTNPFGAGLGYDPARPVVKTTQITNSRVELPSAAYALDVSSLYFFVSYSTSTSILACTFGRLHVGFGSPFSVV